MTAARIFLPALDTRWRLLADFVPDDLFKDDRDNDETLWGMEKYSFDRFREETGISTSGHGQDWVPHFHDWKRKKRLERGFDGTLPEGTIIQIERYHVSRSGENQITTKVLLSPSKFLTPKKQKGVMRGTGRLYFTLGQFNLLPELELFDGDLP